MEGLNLDQTLQRSPTFRLVQRGLQLQTPYFFVTANLVNRRILGDESISYTAIFAPLLGQLHAWLRLRGLFRKNPAAFRRSSLFRSFHGHIFVFLSSVYVRMRSLPSRQTGSCRLAG